MANQFKIIFYQQIEYKFLILLIIQLSVLKASSQGLSFNSNDSLLAKRTSYEVFKTNIPTFKDHFSIQFDLSIWDNEHLGYVFNIIDDKNNSYSLSFIYAANGAYLNFNIDSKSNKIKIPLNPDLLKKRNWMPVTVNIDLVNDRVEILLNGKKYTAGQLGFDTQITPKITFGKNALYAEVPSMAIKNLLIRDDHKSYHFPLNEWAKEDVYSADGEMTGHVKNPVWLINESYFWTPRFSRSYDEVAGLNFDTKTQQVFIFKSDSLTLYNIAHNEVSDRAYQNQCPVYLLLGKSIISSKENKCYVYEVNRTTAQSPNIASLDLKTLKWEITGDATILEQRHHHNVFFDKNQDSIYLFGGYGSFSYYKDFFRFDKTADTWKKVIFSGDTINPRFFSASSQADDHNDVYIFGGFGNQTGSQIVGGKNFYDLYRINLTSHTIKKCWKIKHQGDNFVPANNLILSADKKYFYTLCYAHDNPKTALRLYRFSIKDGSHQIVSAAIPIISERIETDINLFFNSKLHEFYCTVQEFSDTKHSLIKIYSLFSPPVSEQVYLNSFIKKTGTRKQIQYIGFCLLIILVIGLYYIKKRGKDKIITLADELNLNDAEEKKEEIIRGNAVYLLGDFTVYNRNNKDITYLFSPKIKQLFVLILLHSKDEAGVISKKISSILWPEKDLAKTKNIKGVTINHLRNIISDIEGIELTFSNDTYSFKLNPGFYCDYFILMDKIIEINSKHKPGALSILDNFDLIMRGGLLPDIPEPWLDHSKLAYEEALIPVLLPEIKNHYQPGDVKRTIEIINVILSIDPFNEEAIEYKVKIFRKLKGVEYAHKIYQEFREEYQKSIGIDYPVGFEQLCANRRS